MVTAKNAEDQVCRYPDCTCPLDAPADPNWCARRLPKARSIAGGQIPPRQLPPSSPPMADNMYGCSEHYRDGCANCGGGLAEWPARSLLASPAFWIGGACSAALWVVLFWAAKEWMR